jgi:hypothetical protein
MNPNYDYCLNHPISFIQPKFYSNNSNTNTYKKKKKKKTIINLYFNHFHATFNNQKKPNVIYF